MYLSILFLCFSIYFTQDTPRRVVAIPSFGSSIDKSSTHEAFCVMKITASNYIGVRFGRFTVIAVAGLDKHNNRLVTCKCNCGTIRDVTLSTLRSGASRSCGCLRVDLFMKRTITHGLHKRNGLYVTWCSMINRCENPKNERYKNYGARGITVCEEWRNGYKVFYKWAIGAGYSKGLSIERIDNDKGYSPENCKWIPRGEQSFNKSNVPLIEHNGKKLCAQHWGKELNIPIYRIKKGLNDGKTIQQIIDQGKKRIRRTLAQIEHDKRNPKQKRYMI